MIEQATGKATYHGSRAEEGIDAENDEETAEAERTMSVA